MQAARRLYLYAMSGITLGVIAVGFVLLVQALLDGVFPDPEFGGIRDVRQQLSQAVAMLGVGLPVWAVHWWLAQRGLRDGRPERDAERGSAVRAVYLTLVLAVSLVAWVASAITLLHWAITSALDATPEFSFQDPVGAAAAGTTAFIVWLYHGLVRRRDLAAGPVAGPAAWVPRLYLYGISLGALIAAVSGLDVLISSFLIRPDFGGDEVFATWLLVQQLVTATAWAIVWFAHWTYAGRLARDPGWRGTEERASRMRVGAFVAAILLAAVSTLTGIATAFGGLLLQLFPDDGNAFTTEDGMTVAVASLSRALPWAVIWFAHAQALRREPAATDPQRALHQERLVTHGIAAVALAIGAIGAGWILGFLLDWLLGGDRSVGGIEPQLYEIRQWLPYAVVGFAAWTWSWRAVVARRRLDPVGEAQSTIRRAFLYLTIAVALVASIVAAALILYRFVGLLLDAGLGGNLASGLSTPLGYLAVAVVVLAYHGLQLRTDLDRAEAAEGSDVATATVVPDAGAIAAAAPSDAGPAEAPAEAMAMERRAFELVGQPGADLDAALSAARSALPLGVELVVLEG